VQTCQNALQLFLNVCMCIMRYGLFIVPCYKPVIQIEFKWPLVLFIFEDLYTVCSSKLETIILCCEMCVNSRRVL
jgi:hypothetical protein